MLFMHGMLRCMDYDNIFFSIIVLKTWLNVYFNLASR